MRELRIYLAEWVMEIAFNLLPKDSPEAAWYAHAMELYLKHCMVDGGKQV